MSLDRLDVYKQLPIPAWLQLTCVQCGYDLTGVPEHRCPECGLRFDMDAIVNPYMPLRPPEIAPTTRPVPEMGLTCYECDASLTGATADRCPECDEPFDLEEYIPDGPWPVLDVVCNDLEKHLIREQLRGDGIPCPPVDGHEEPAAALRSPSLTVRRDYYFDALRVIFKNGEKSSTPWTCPSCGQSVPGNFEICWRCQTPQPENGVSS